jgi:hypothetical protein
MVSVTSMVDIKLLISNGMLQQNQYADTQPVSRNQQKL